MPNFFLADMVREMSSTTGTGAFTLDGPTPGHRSFAAALSAQGANPAAATFPYAICGVSDESQWETGTGTLSPTGQLIRSPKSSSAGGGLVNFGAGLKTVALTLTADWAGAVAADAAAPVAIANISGLSQALSAKENLLSGNPQTGHLAAQDGVAITRGGQTVNALGGTICARRAADGPYVAEGNVHIHGVMAGGLGAQSTIFGQPDWNSADAAQSGQGIRLMGPSDTNGPPRGLYFHPLTFEYSPVKAGSGNMTQLAVPYFDATGYFGLRFRFGGAWSAWRAIMMENSAGQVLPSIDNSSSLGSSSIRFSTVFAASGAINTSDEREKRDISAIPDPWLDAWGDVEWARFRFKGGRRWHVGLIAQRVHAAFAARGLDAFDIGLCCFDQWDEQREPVLDADGNLASEGEVSRPSGDLWGLRYDECFALESAWVRRELSRKSDKRNRRHDT